MAEKPMTKTEAYEWIKRARQGLRDMEAAIAQGDEQLLREGLLEATAAPCEVEAAIDDHGPGLNGVTV